MNKTIKRILVMLLAAALLCGGLAVGASAEGTDITAAFTDPNFLAEVRLRVRKPEPQPILDTDAAAVTSIFTGGGGNIHSLAGLEYFTNLETLTCFNNFLTSLPPLPSTLKILIVSNNQLSALPALPAGLEELNFSQNQFTSVPELPAGLTSLSCSKNQLTELPALPAGLKELFCNDNLLTELPALPPVMRKLGCSDNQLTAIPDTLVTEDLYCANNQLTALPRLGAGIESLICSGNRLTGLNLQGIRVGMGGLRVLYCDHNDMTTARDVAGVPLTTWDDAYFRFFPQNMHEPLTPDTEISAAFTDPEFLKMVRHWIGRYSGDILYRYVMDHENFTAVPNAERGIGKAKSIAGIHLFKSLKNFYCGNNALTMLPKLPDTLENLYCESNPITDIRSPLPPNLEGLYCYGCGSLTYLPALPPSLKYLSCPNTSMRSLPALPAGLQSLWCDNCPLARLPALPAGLERLSCAGNYLTRLDLTGLDSLTYVDCQKNDMTSPDDVLGFNGTWDGVNFVFYPQRNATPFANTIFSTKYEATTWNWILFWFFFGWIWMWF